MTPRLLTLEPITAGDTWDTFPTSVTVRVNGVAPTFPLASARLRLAKTTTAGTTTIELTSAAGKISITSSAGWIISIPPQAVPLLTAGSWKWKLETTDSVGTVKTYLQGTQLVRPDV